jgi:hypothetical protein
MNTYRIAILAMSLLGLVGVTALTSEAKTTFIGSTIVGIDEAQRTVTFRTMEGQDWTLPVVDPSILKEQHLSSGDHVTIELDLSDRISKIIKLAEEPRSETRQPS